MVAPKNYLRDKSIFHLDRVLVRFVHEMCKISLELVTHLLNTAATESQQHVHWDICLPIEKHNVK